MSFARWIAFFTISILATPANAQFAIPGLTAMNIEISGNMQRASARMANDSENAAKGRVVKDESDEMDSNRFLYRASSERRQQNISAFATSMRSSGNPEGATVIETSGTKIFSAIDQALEARGLRSNNVADAYAVWWVASWEAVHGQETGDSTALYQAVKKQAQAAMNATPAIANASDTLKQELADSMLLYAALIESYVDNAAGNPSQKAAVAKAINDGAKTMGLDLTQMTLTEQGFAMR